MMPEPMPGWVNGGDQVNQRRDGRTGLLRERGTVSRLRNMFEFLETIGFRAALIGGLAVAYHANPPITADVDLLIYGYWKELLKACKKYCRPLGFRVTVFGFLTKRQRLGQPMKGVRLITPEGDYTFDLLTTGRDQYLRSVIDRSVEITLYSMPQNLARIEPQEMADIRVVMPEDLVVMKIMSGREKDVDDVRVLVASGWRPVNHEQIALTMASLKL